MLRWMIDTSLKFRFVVVGLAVLLVLYGIAQLRGMPVDVFPEFEAPTVEVQTEALGLSAQEVADLVTLNLEELLSGVPWLTSIRSQSVTGLSSIVMTFERGTDLTKARQMIQERLTLAYTLPNVAQPPVMLQPVSAIDRVMIVGISSEEVEETQLSLIARWTIKPALLGVPGVANVAIWGQRLQQMHVQFDPDRLREAGLVQQDILEAAGDSLWVTPLTFLRGSAPGTGGWIDNTNQRIGVHHDMPLKTPEDMANIAMTPRHLLLTGKTLSLGDVTETTFSHPMMIGDAYVNKGRGLALVIQKLPSANMLEVTRGIEETIETLKAGLPGVKIDTNVFRLASYVDESLARLTTGFAIGAVLVVLVIAAFLSNVRSVLISIVAIPISLFSAIIVLKSMGTTLNTMILAGLVLALTVIIDDAVVTMERLLGRLRQRAEGSGETISEIIYATTLKTHSATVYALLILILAVTPIFFMGGIGTAFFGPMAKAYLLAVLTSMLTGLTVTPALRLILLAKPPYGFVESPIAVGLRSWFEGVHERIMGAPGKMYKVAFLLIILGLGIWPFLGKSLLPSLQERTVTVNMNTPPGTSHQETFRIASRLSQELQSLPGVVNVGAHIGRAITGDEVVGIHSGQIWVDIDPKADYDDTVASIRETINSYPGMDNYLQTYLRSSISKVLTGEKAAVVVRVYGQRREIMLQKAEEVRAAISNISGLTDVHVVGQTEEPQIIVNVDLDAAGRYGVKPGDVRRSSATVFSGLTVGFLFEEQKINDVVVWGAPETRQSIDDVHNVWVDKIDRNRIRLDDVADVSVMPTPTVIRHEKIFPYVDVVGDVRDRDLGAIHHEIKTHLENVEFPLEYHAEILGEYVEQQNIEDQIQWTVVVALMGIFLLLQACFQSWSMAAIAFLALPAAIAGGSLATLLSGGVVSLGSIVGFLAVIGIASRNAILLIKHYEQRRSIPSESGPGFSIILRRTRERFLPIVASTLAMIVVLLPIVIFGHAPGVEIIRPMAIVMIGGILASALTTLFVMPALYDKFVGLYPGRQKDADF